MDNMIMALTPFLVFVSTMLCLTVWLWYCIQRERGVRYTIHSTMYASGAEEHTILQWGSILYEYADHSYSCSVTFNTKKRAEQWIAERTVV